MTEFPVPSRLRFVEGRRIVVAGLIVNICLTVMKLAGGILGHSQSLIADGFHSLSDLATDFVVFFGLQYSAKPRDANHPYGHGKIETLATTFVGVLLILTGFLLGYEGLRASLDHPENVPNAAAFVIVVASIVFKEVLYRYTLRYARRINSSALVANAWHHRSDAMSSVAALIGIGGARLGLPVLDPIGAIAVGLMIVKVGVDVVVKASRELVEESLRDTETSAMIAVALGVPGVRSVSEIYSRYVGPSIVVDISITVDGHLSVAAGHEIAHGVEASLTSDVAEVEVVTVHVEPYTVDAAPEAPPRDARVTRTSQD